MDFNAFFGILFALFVLMFVLLSRGRNKQDRRAPNEKVWDEDEENDVEEGRGVREVSGVRDAVSMMEKEFKALKTIQQKKPKKMATYQNKQADLSSPKYRTGEVKRSKYLAYQVKENRHPSRGIESIKQLKSKRELFIIQAILDRPYNN